MKILSGINRSVAQKRLETAGDDCVYAATGSSFTVPLKHELKESDNLKWFKDASVVFSRRRKLVISGKNDDVDSTGSLKLTKLTKDMSGRYRPEVYSADGVNVGKNLQSVHLCVLDRVQKPTVTTKTCTDNGHVHFTCSVGQNETITWLMDGEMLEEKGKTLTRVAKDVLNANFSCNVSNPVSSEVSPPVQQNCYKPSFPKELFGISIWVFIGGGAGTCHVLIEIKSSYFGDRHCHSLLCPGQTKETHMINGKCIYLYTVIIIILVHVKNISHCAKTEHLKNYFTYVNDLVHPCTAHPFTIHCACRLLEELPKAQS
uniref:Ig-like domain-containing protein n=1 Tax=Neolamprologus brichardi TaxID=32507 RepID=A0A3Q4HQA0_NEOBR